MNRGRPFGPGNQFGRGRPRGSRNKRSLIVKQLLDQHSEAIIHKSLVLALHGDGPLLRTLLSYILPRPSTGTRSPNSLRSGKRRWHEGLPGRIQANQFCTSLREFTAKKKRLPTKDTIGHAPPVTPRRKRSSSDRDRERNCRDRAGVR